MTASVTASIAVVLLLTTTYACEGVLSWRTIYTSKSPDGEAIVLLQLRNCLGDCAARVVVRDRYGARTRELAAKGDCSVNFAHAAWIGAGHSRVAVFADGGFCGLITAAHDLDASRPLEFRQLEPALKASIIEEYRVTPQELAANEGDVFRWATYPGDGRPRRSVQDFEVLPVPYSPRSAK